MCPPSQRADALNAITLVENIARLATVGGFGFIFAILADVGKAYLTFFCNAVSRELAPLCPHLRPHNLTRLRPSPCLGWEFSCSPISHRRVAFWLKMWSQKRVAAKVSQSLNELCTKWGLQLAVADLSSVVARS